MSHVNELKTSKLYIGNSGSATEVTASAAKLNLIKDSVAGSIVNNAAVIYGSSGEVNVSELQIGGTSVTANAGEINILDGVTNVTSSNINHLSGVESSIKDDLLARYTKLQADDKFSVKEGSTSLTKVGPLIQGSITSTFGDIDIGNSNIKSGTLQAGDVTVDGSKIGHVNDADLMVLSSGLVSVNGAIDTSTLKISNQTVTASADELNILDGADVNTSDLNAIKGLVNVTAANINQLAGVSTSIATEIRK